MELLIINRTWAVVLGFMALISGISCGPQQQQPTFQQGVMPSGLMAGVQDCPTNILFSIVATCTSIQSQLPTLVERLRDAIRIQEESNDFSPSDIAKMRETSTGLCEMADPMLSCLKLLGQCPSLLGSLGSGVDDARGVLQVMCVNRSLERYLDCTERNGGMNIRQRYCSQYRNYTLAEAAPKTQNSDSIRSTISSLASFQGISGLLNEGATLPGESIGGGVSGLMGPNGPKTSLNCPVFTLFSGCMASAVKKVCGREESESMYYVSQIQAKTSSESPCQLPPSIEQAETIYLQNQYRMQATTNVKPTQPVPITIPSIGASRTQRRPGSRRPTTTQSSLPQQPASEDRSPGTPWPGQDATTFWMPNRLRQQATSGKRPPVSPTPPSNVNGNQPWWWNPEEGSTTPADGSNVIVLQLATTPEVAVVDNNKVSSELRQNAFDWSDDEEAAYGSRRGDSAASQPSLLTSLTCFVLFLHFALSTLL